MPRKDKERYNAYMRSYMLKRYHERRALALDYLGGFCVYCGSTEKLEFDHIDRTSKSFPISKLWSTAEDKFWEEIEVSGTLSQLSRR